jgi:MoaA/NifB/PqqE/SkfB family radical SAM enzyme
MRPKSFYKKLLDLKNKLFTPPAAIRKCRWRLLQVEPALACNLKCVMCPWHETRAKAANRGIMRQEIWDAIKPHLSEALSVDFTGGGEPLLQPRLADWISDAKIAGCQTGFLTNGLLLDRDMADRILAVGPDWICFSMDGADKEIYESIRIGSDFDKLCTNISDFVRLSAGTEIIIMLNFVLMHVNFHQIDDIVRLAADLGVHQINFKQCDVIRGEHGKGYGLFASQDAKMLQTYLRRLANAEKLARKLKIRITAFSFFPTEAPVCAQDPRDSMFVGFDGSVAPCIGLAYGGPTTFFGEDTVMPTLHYGRLPQQDLMEVWETPICREFRNCFRERVVAYENVYKRALERGDMTDGKLAEDAVSRMPPPPDGCKVCHYLYDI